MEPNGTIDGEGGTNKSNSEAGLQNGKSGNGICQSEEKLIRG